MYLVAVKDQSFWFQVESPLEVEKSVWARAAWKLDRRGKATTARASSDGIEYLYLVPTRSNDLNYFTKEFSASKQSQ